MGRIEISIEFGKFETLKIGSTLIQDLPTAIAIVRASKLRNVQLKHILPSGCSDEWDNF
jgi:hypothetical protein